MDVIHTAALVLAITGLLPLALCLIKIYQLKKYKAKATITTAAILQSEKRKGYKNSTYYLLDIRYIIHTGVPYNGKTISWKKYSAGDTMPLMYATDNPSNFKTDFGQSLKWLLPASIFLLAGVAWVCYWLLTREYTYRPS